MDIPLPNITAAVSPGLSPNGTTPFAPDRHPIQPQFQFLSAGGGCRPDTVVANPARCSSRPDDRPHRTIAAMVIDAAVPTDRRRFLVRRGRWRPVRVAVRDAAQPGGSYSPPRGITRAGGSEAGGNRAGRSRDYSRDHLHPGTYRCGTGA